MADWYFEDIHGKIQGPFNGDEMRAWFVAGYLKADLMITHNPSKGLNPLRDWFPNLENAFLPGSEGKPGRQGPANTARASQELRWYFLDKNRQMQGPFAGKQMRLWFEGGYFEPTLLIYDASKSESEWGWKTLRDYFPNVDLAFSVEPGQGGRGPGAGAGPKKTISPADSRFTFPDWLPTPPPFRDVKKVYPSEKAVTAA